MTPSQLEDRLFWCFGKLLQMAVALALVSCSSTGAAGTTRSAAVPRVGKALTARQTCGAPLHGLT